MAKSPRDQAADALAAMSGGASPEPAEAADISAGGDEQLAAPAPDASVFAPRKRTADLLALRRLHTRRTAIPILLTCGLLLPLVGSLRWLAPEETPFAQSEVWVSIVLIMLGVSLLTMAVLNMLHVRGQLRN